MHRVTPTETAVPGGKRCWRYSTQRILLKEMEMEMLAVPVSTLHCRWLTSDRLYAGRGLGGDK
jgi:hypothetical protein